MRHRGWKLQEGDRVTFSVADSCGLCPECTLHKCPGWDWLGNVKVDEVDSHNYNEP